MHLVVKAVHFCLIYSLVLSPSTSVFICFGISCDSDDAWWAIAVWHQFSFKGGQAGGVGQKADKSAIKCMQMKPQVITSAGVCVKVWVLRCGRVCGPASSVMFTSPLCERSCNETWSSTARAVWRLCMVALSACLISPGSPHSPCLSPLTSSHIQTQSCKGSDALREMVPTNHTHVFVALSLCFSCKGLLVLLTHPDYWDWWIQNTIWISCKDLYDKCACVCNNECIFVHLQTSVCMNVWSGLKWWQISVFLV